MNLRLRRLMQRAAARDPSKFGGIDGLHQVEQTIPGCIQLGPLMFQRTLALSYNPFDPEDFAPSWLNLGGGPLRVDKEPKLMDLFSWKLGGLQENKIVIDNFLFGPSSGQAKPPIKPGILFISGGKGTGKTTLAAYVKRQALEESATPAAEWKICEEEFPEANDVTRPAAFVERVNALREKIKGMLGQQRENVLIFLDDMPAGGFGAINSLYRDFKTHAQVYVVTTVDLTLKQKELDWNEARTRVVNTRNVNAIELQDYIRDRVTRYRDPNRPEFANISVTFPWASTAASRIIGNEANSDQPLRLLNKWLSREVEKYHLEYSNNPQVDMKTLAQTALAQYLIP